MPKKLKTYSIAPYYREFFGFFGRIYICFWKMFEILCAFLFFLGKRGKIRCNLSPAPDLSSNQGSLSSNILLFCRQIINIPQKNTYYRPKKSKKNYSIILRYLIDFFSNCALRPSIFSTLSR